ncbi:MerR family transcriptional regulator [Rhodoglobus sp.]
MLIGEIATIAQVSPRAIRHYHRVGVLPEPARSSNSYRVYSVMDLTRLLRIRRLIHLGFPLHRIAETLRNEPEVLDSELGALEDDVLGQIDRLHQQLAAIRSARASASPDSIVVYDTSHEAVRELWALPGVQGIERDVGLLLASAGDEGLLERLREGLDDPAQLSRIIRLSRRFRSIDEDSSPGDRDSVVSELRRVFAQWSDLVVQPQLSELVNSYLKQAFTAPQLDMIATAAERLDEDDSSPA